jgi:hypothetical protein
MRGTAGSTAAPAARCRKARRGSFSLNLPFASHHSITSSVRASSIGGLSSPSVFAVREYAERAAFLADPAAVSHGGSFPGGPDHGAACTSSLSLGPNPSSASRFAAGAAEFLLLSQSGEWPEDTGSRAERRSSFPERQYE